MIEVRDVTKNFGRQAVLRGVSLDIRRGEAVVNAFGWKLPTSRLTTREAPERFLYVTRKEAPADYYVLGFQTEIHFKPRASTSRITTRESPHNQNYD